MVVGLKPANRTKGFVCELCMGCPWFVQNLKKKSLIHVVLLDGTKKYIILSFMCRSC